jgi:DNA integrity scanning protein DisA with diadenylate cyclase activity
LQDIILYGKKTLLIEQSDFLSTMEEYTKTIDAKMAKLKEEDYEYVVCLADIHANKMPQSLLANLYRESKFMWGWVNQ